MAVIVSACPYCGHSESRETYDVGSGPELSCSECEWCWGAQGQDLKPVPVPRMLHGLSSAKEILGDPVLRAELEERLSALVLEFEGLRLGIVATFAMLQRAGWPVEEIADAGSTTAAFVANMLRESDG